MGQAVLNHTRMPHSTVIPGEQNDVERDPRFDRPFGKLTVLSKVEGLTTLSEVDPSTWLRVDAEQDRSIEGESRELGGNQIIPDLPPPSAGDDE